MVGKDINYLPTFNFTLSCVKDKVAKVKSLAIDMMHNHWHAAKLYRAMLIILKYMIYKQFKE